jgi:hypothetical protein
MSTPVHVDEKLMLGATKVLDGGDHLVLGTLLHPLVELQIDLLLGREIVHNVHCGIGGTDDGRI